MVAWLATTTDGQHFHVLPIDDLVDHHEDHDGTCACIPLIEPVPREDGSIGWLLVHHSLDGREATE